MASSKKPTPPKNISHSVVSGLLGDTINVALVGCGGNGSQMLYKLARLDFALREAGHQKGLHVVAYDPDLVSPSNIGRQLFSSDDVGLYKSVVLVNRVNLTFGLYWQARTERYVEPAYWDRWGGSPHILITCVDTAAARRDIWHALTKAKSSVKPKYWLDLGNMRSEGQVILGQPPFTDELVTATVPEGQWGTVPGRILLNDARKKMEARRLQTVVEVFPALLDRRRKEDDTPSCSLAEALGKQSLFVNDHMSSWAAQMLDTLLREGKIDYHGVFINLQSGATRALPIREREVVIKTRRARTARAA